MEAKVLYQPTLQHSNGYDAEIIQVISSPHKYS